MYLHLAGLPITAERLQQLAGDKAVNIGRSGQPTSERPVAARPVCGLDCCQASAHRSDSPLSGTAPALVIERAMGVDGDGTFGSGKVRLILSLKHSQNPPGWVISQNGAYANSQL